MTVTAKATNVSSADKTTSVYTSLIEEKLQFQLGFFFWGGGGYYMSTSDRFYVSNDAGKPWICPSTNCGVYQKEKSHIQDTHP